MSYISEVDHENGQCASSQPRILGIAFACGAWRGNPDHETEQTRGAVVPLSPAAADTGTASGHRSCDWSDGTRPALGRRPTSFHARRHARAMMVSFDTNVLVYATVSAPLSKTTRARDLVVRGMRAGGSILLLQTLAEFSSVAIRKAGIAVDDVRTTIDAWRAVLPVQGTEDDDLSAALDAVKKHRLAFWDAMLWAAAQRAGVRHLLTEDLQDGLALAGVRFVNPFDAANNRLI